MARPGPLGHTDDVGVGVWVGVGVMAVGAPQERRAAIGRDRKTDRHARRGGDVEVARAVNELRRAERANAAGDRVDAATLVAFLTGVDRRPGDHRPPVRCDLGLELGALKSRADGDRLAQFTVAGHRDRAYLARHRVYDDQRPVRRERECDVTHARVVVHGADDVRRFRPVRSQRDAQRVEPVASIFGPRRARPVLAPTGERAHVARLARPQFDLLVEVTSPVDGGKTRSPAPELRVGPVAERQHATRPSGARTRRGTRQRRPPARRPSRPRPARSLERGRPRGRGDGLGRWRCRPLVPWRCRL